jgi:hypothetical protein
MSARRAAARRRRARPGGSHASPHVLGEPIARTGPVVLTAVPSRRKRLSDGVLVEALVLGRVLGMRILTLRASVVLAPAEVTSPTSADRAVALPPAARPAGLVPARRPVAGRRLAEAVRRIDEGAQLLADARRNGVAGQRERDAR